MINLGCRHSSVDSPAPTILTPRVQIPCTSSTVISFIVVLVLYFFCFVKKTKINEKRVWPYFLNDQFLYGLTCWILLTNPDTDYFINTLQIWRSCFVIVNLFIIFLPFSRLILNTLKQWKIKFYFLAVSYLMSMIWMNTFTRINISFTSARFKKKFAKVGASCPLDCIVS